MPHRRDCLLGMGASAYWVWELPPNVAGTAQRRIQEIGQFVGARGIVCRTGTQVNRKMSHEVGALERRERQQSMRCRKTCDKGAKITEILGTSCSTLWLARSGGIQLLEITGSFWRFYGIVGLACCTPDTAKHAGQPQAEGRTPAVALAVRPRGPAGMTSGLVPCCGCHGCPWTVQGGHGPTCG